MANGDVVADPEGTEVVLGDIGHEIVFENEHVRVWEVRLEPGEVQDWHLHHNPYLIVGIEGALNRMDFLDGSEPRIMEETAGRVVYREAGTVHKLTNVGETRYVNRLVELKTVGRDEQNRNGRNGNGKHG
jgi:quercetin dioxygenase-like cupin family protein